MALKRKRSAQAFSSPSSDASDTSTQFSPLPLFYQQSKPVDPLFHKPAWSWPMYDDTPSKQHLNSRTRKRHRDNRPDEQQVYGVSCWLGAVTDMRALTDACRLAESTISRLYEAQKQQPYAEPVYSHQIPQAQHTQPQRSTLHSFWRIAQPPSATPMFVDSATPSDLNVDMRCEDCDGTLTNCNAMDVEEDVLAQETSCHACNRQVCDRCAVSGDVRICLGCVRTT